MQQLQTNLLPNNPPGQAGCLWFWTEIGIYTFFFFFLLKMELPWDYEDLVNISIQEDIWSWKSSSFSSQRINLEKLGTEREIGREANGVTQKHINQTRSSWQYSMRLKCWRFITWDCFTGDEEASCLGLWWLIINQKRACKISYFVWSMKYLPTEWLTKKIELVAGI